MISFFRTITKPEVYHEQNFRQTFFEGWYFKSVSVKHNNKLAIIPGIFKNKKNNKKFAFIQFLDGQNNKSHFIDFDVNLFNADRKKFYLEIENSIFSLDELKIDIKRESFLAFGYLKFNDVNSWPITFLSPGAMGWYSYVPFMECNHGILSFNNTVSGKILINDDVYIFTNDKGYIEKDWGSSFPSSYIWLQSNNFSNPNLSISLSIARIPWLFSSFSGVLAGLYLDGELYPFTTYNNTKIKKLEKINNLISITLENKKYILEIEALKSEDSGILVAPYYDEMRTRINESLNSVTKLLLMKKIGKYNKLIIEDIGYHTGIEIVGNIDELR